MSDENIVVEVGGQGKRGEEFGFVLAALAALPALISGVKAVRDVVSGAVSHGRTTSAAPAAAVAANPAHVVDWQGGKLTVGELRDRYAKSLNDLRLTGKRMDGVMSSVQMLHAELAARSAATEKLKTELSTKTGPRSWIVPAGTALAGLLAGIMAGRATK